MENRILVLDDDPGILEAIDLSLTFSGFQVRPLLFGDNVFRMISNFEPNLIIIDYKLKGEDGGEICIKLKSNPDTKDIPVIMLSGHPDVHSRANDYHFDAFIPKPFDLNTLVGKIRTFINPEPALIKGNLKSS